MAERRTTPPERPLLLWPRQRIISTVAEQLDTARKMAELLASPEVLDDIDELWTVTPDSWHRRNRTILEQACTTAELVDQYDPPVRIRAFDASGIALRPSERLWHLRQTLELRSRSLREIVDRLDLYDELPGITASADAAGHKPAEGLVFVVHGRDDATKNEVARTLHQLTGRDPVILHEQPDAGATIIEKFERHASTATAAVVILSPDDVGGLADDNPQQHPRARQNVVYELGWFHGRLGRGQVIALVLDDVEKPSDISGVLYIPVDSGGAWRTTLGRELRTAGINADLNRLR